MKLAVSCVMVFAVAFVKEGEPIAGAGPGILWIAVLFAGTLALSRTFERERHGEPSRALLLAPAPRAAIYVGKLLGIVLLMTLAEVQELQRRLTSLGFDTDGSDGRVGRDTQRAVRDFQKKVGLSPADGYAGLKVLARLRQGA